MEPLGDPVAVAWFEAVVAVEEHNALEPCRQQGLSVNEAPRERTSAAVAGQCDRQVRRIADGGPNLIDDRDDARVGAVKPAHTAPLRPALRVGLEVSDDRLFESARAECTRLRADLLNVVAPADAFDQLA